MNDKLRMNTFLTLEQKESTLNTVSRFRPRHERAYNPRPHVGGYGRDGRGWCP